MEKPHFFQPSRPEHIPSVEWSFLKLGHETREMVLSRIHIYMSKNRHYLRVKGWKTSFTEIGCRENQLNTDEHKTSQRILKSQKIRTYCQRWYDVLCPAFPLVMTMCGCHATKSRLGKGKNVEARVVPALLSGYMGTASIPPGIGVKKQGSDVYLYPWASVHQAERRVRVWDKYNLIWPRIMAQRTRQTGGEKTFHSNIRHSSLVKGLLCIYP